MKSMRTVARLIATLVLIMLQFNLQTLTKAQNVRTVALTSQPTPGAGANVEFTSFLSTPMLNKKNETAFVAFFAGPGVANGNDSAIFREIAGAGLGLVARAGTNAQGAGPGVNFEFFDPPILNSNGDSAFHANLIGGGVTGISNTGIFREGLAGGVNLVARKGNTAPTAAINVDYAGFTQLQFAATNQTAFVADLAGPGVSDMNDSGIFRELMGPGVANVARAGDVASGTGPGVFYMDFPKMLLNDAGRIAFFADLDGPNVNSTSDQGIFREDITGTIQLVARSGDIAPIGSGITYGDLREPAFNEIGLTAFAAELDGVGVNETNDQALFREVAGVGVNLAYRSGNPTPGTSNGVVFSFFGNPLLNNTGQIAFLAYLDGTEVNESNDLGVFSETPLRQLELVARTGDVAPGTNATFATFSKPAYNNQGQVAFVGLLTGADVDSSNDVGIFAQDLSGQLKLIVREGDEMDVSDDPANPDLRIVSDNSFGRFGEEIVTLNGFNDLGAVVFTSAFEDGSEGVFVANTTVLLGDLNGDGDVNLLDISPFVDAITGGTFVEEGDINQDGQLNLLDVSPFVALLVG